MVKNLIITLIKQTRMKKIYFTFFIVFTFVSAVAAADVITQNVPNGCGLDYLRAENNNEANLYSIWVPNSYTCNFGYFLPANSVDCTKCLTDYICAGGTYVFNERIDQGIEYSSILTQPLANGCLDVYKSPLDGRARFLATWKINSYDCSGGYYLPADGIECVVCPNNNYCPGGKYEYSETVAQGIMECPNNMFSPVGVFEVGACGRKLRIGDEILYFRSQKKTTPSLNFDINHDGIPDFFGNATLQRTTINSSSQRYLHVGEYYIYDDSIRLEE